MISIIEESVELHDSLNPKLWMNNKLIPAVKSKVLGIVDEFIDYVDIPMNIVDIHLLGSNASYNYTNNSDIDIHIVVNYDLMDASTEILQTMYNSAKTDFNKTYDISFKGINVELYVEDVKANTVSNGIYSVYEDKWIKFPEKINVPDVEIDQDLIPIKNSIGMLLSTGSIDDIEKEINSLYLLRKNSLTTDGEFGKGNLIFKEIRNCGLLDDLKDRRVELKSKQLSLENISKK